MNKKTYGITIAIMIVFLIAGILMGNGTEKKETTPEDLPSEVPPVKEIPALPALAVPETTNITWGNETCDVWVKNLNSDNKSVQITLGRLIVYNSTLHSGEKRSFSLQHLIGEVTTERDLSITADGERIVQKRISLDCTVSSDGSGAGTNGATTITPPPPVPEAPSVLLMGLGILGLFAIARLRK